MPEIEMSATPAASRQAKLLQPKQRKNHRTGSKLVINGCNNPKVEAHEGLVDLNKITLIIPADARITVTLTMSDNRTVRRIVFENTDPVHEMKGRIYFNVAQGRFAVGNGGSVPKPEARGPAYHLFQTRGTVTQLEDTEDDITFRGTAQAGVRKITQAEMMENATTAPKPAAESLSLSTN